MVCDLYTAYSYYGFDNVVGIYYNMGPELRGKLYCCLKLNK